jgi:TPR repeat protein
MNRTCKAAVAGLILAYGIAGSAVAGLFEDGLNAWERGDYSTAMRFFRPLADRGDPKAQYRVGVMYQHGWGVPLDHSGAVSWFRQAADQGDAEAQNDLGFMFLYGRGVSQDYVGAHMWFNLAAAGGSTYAVFARDLVAAKMTPTQIAEAQKLARTWKPK